MPASARDLAGLGVERGDPAEAPGQRGDRRLLDGRCRSSWRTVARGLRAAFEASGVPAGQQLPAGGGRRRSARRRARAPTCRPACPPGSRAPAGRSFSAFPSPAGRPCRRSRRGSAVRQGAGRRRPGGRSACRCGRRWRRARGRPWCGRGQLVALAERPGKVSERSHWTRFLLDRERHVAADGAEDPCLDQHREDDVIAVAAGLA